MERGQHLEELFDAAFELDESQREQFLASDVVPPDLRDELAQLLRAIKAQSPLDRNPAGLAQAAAWLSGPAETGNTITANQRIGHYRLLRMIGEGGMASVWLADRDDGVFTHQVAVKCLKTGLASPESRARFLREQQILAQLQHPNIARLYDAGISDDGVPFIVMEWIDGLSLIRYCDENRLGTRQRLLIFLKVCAAVAYAHQNLVVHRDIKPGNVLIGSDGEPKLLDFGIAKLLDDDTQPVTRTGIQLLTPEYAAPEQFSGAAITTATDTFALGAVLYELLCGLRPRQFLRGQTIDTTTPFTAPSDALRRVLKTKNSTEKEAVKKAINARTSTHERLRRTLSGDLDTIVLKALQHEPSRRYATAQAFSEDISKYLNQQPIQARKVAWAYRVHLFLRRHALGVAISALVVAALLTATGISLYQAQRARIEARNALAVKKFLSNLFEMSDTGLPRDQSPTAETLLKDGAQRIRHEFNEAPELKLDLLLLLGRVQSNLGFYEPADELLNEAIKLAQSAFTPADESWLNAHTERAALLFKRSQFDTAAKDLENAIERHRVAHVAGSAALGDALITVAAAYGRLDRFDESIAATRQALELFKRLNGEHDASVQRALQGLGKALKSAKHWDEAETTQRANVALSRELYGEQHATLAASLAELADTLRLGTTNYAEAEQIARQALAIDEAVYSHPNAAVIYTLNSLAGVLINQDKLDEAESLYRRVLAMRTELLGKDDPTVADALYNLGLITCRRFRFNEAERLFRQSLQLTRQHEGENSSRVAETLNELSLTLNYQGRYAEALRASQEALAIYRNSFGNQAEAVGWALTYLAYIEKDAAHPQAALRYLDEALPILQKTLGAGHIRLIETRFVKADVLNRMRQYQAAREVLQPLIADLRSSQLTPRQKHALENALTTLGHAQFGLGQYAQAQTSWQEALNLERTLSQLHAVADASNAAALEKLIAQVNQKLSIRPKAVPKAP